jgi:transposase
MAAAIGVRTDHSSEDLRRFAQRCGDADQVRGLLAIALILDGGSRSDAAKFAGVTLQIVRNWVLRFNADGPDGLATRKAPGRASILNDEQRARLAEVVEAGPIPAAHGVVRWRLADLAQWVWGGRTKPGSGSRPSLPGAGQGAARVPLLLAINGGPRPGSSARSVPLKARLPASSCPAATARQ